MNTTVKERSSEDLAMQQEVIDKALEASERMTSALANMAAALGARLPGYVADQPLGVAVDGLSTLDKSVAALEKALGEVKAKLSFAKEVSMPQRMDAESVKTFNTDNFRVTRTARVFASITAEQIETAYEWLRDNGYGSLIKETVNSSSLSAAAKEMMQEGEELPEELFKVHMKDGISITKK